MTRRFSMLSRGGAARPAALGVFLVVQTVAAVYFVSEGLEDLFLETTPAGVAEPEPNAGTATVADTFEAIVALALFAGVAFGAVEMLRVLRRADAAETALSAAQGALADVVAAHFDRWGLTPAEREVALFALKGADVAEIAELRGAARGTVRAQLARVYAKAGVASRTELMSIFIDELLGGPIVPPTAHEATPSTAA